MVTKNKKRILGGLAGLVILSTMLFSFSTTRFGGDVFRIYLNNKMVLEEFVYKSSGVQNVSLDNASLNDNVNVYYSHCGQAGQSRSITIKSDDGKLLKQWHFSDASSASNGMSISVRDLVNLQKANGGDAIEIFYSAKQLPNGRQLANINMGALAKVKP